MWDIPFRLFGKIRESLLCGCFLKYTVASCYADNHQGNQGKAADQQPESNALH